MDLLYREVSSYQGKFLLKEPIWTQQSVQRCPYFRGVLYEGFHCSYKFVKVGCTDQVNVIHRSR